MAKPDFTRPEQLLIDRILQPDASNLMFEVSYLVPSAVLVAIGFAYNAAPAFAAAFGVIATFRYWQISSDRRTMPLMREVIRKYEQACGEATGPGAAS